MAVVRRPNINEAYAHGAQIVMLVPFTADEISHAPLALSSEEEARWASDVAFIGTWMPERGPFLAELMKLEVPLILYGNLWQKAPSGRSLKIYGAVPGLWGRTM